MSISVSGRVVRARLRDQFIRADNKKTSKLVSIKSNHICVQFSDGTERHFLFDDNVILKSIDRCDQKSELEMTWVHEVWYESVFNGDDGFVEAVKKYDLPIVAKAYSHIRVNLDGNEIHLMLTVKEVKDGLKEAEKCKFLPKISWINDSIFIKGMSQSR